MYKTFALTRALTPPLGAEYEVEVVTTPPSETSTVVDAGLGSMYQCSRRLRSHVH